MRPLSFAQERLWWSGEVAAGSSNIPMALHLRGGAVNIHALEQAIRVVVDRHAILRTRFHTVDGTAAQEVLPTVDDIDLPRVDLQNPLTRDRQRLVEELLAVASDRPLDLSRPPLLTQHLLRLAPDDHFMFVTLSHLTVDERSRHLLMQEIAALYQAMTAGQPLALPAVEAEYGDFAAWEREQFATPGSDKDIRFWRSYLADVRPLLEMPLDHPRPPSRVRKGAWRSRDMIGLPIGDRVRALARAEGVTPFQVLLAAVSVLISRCTGSTDVVFGTPVSRRPHVRYDRVIGPFLNSVAIRTDCSGAPTFRAFLRHVQGSAVAALAHARVPFEVLIDRLQVERDTSYNPLIQIWFIYKPKTTVVTPWHASDVESVEVHETTMPFDITLAVAEGGTGMLCSCSYNTALYEPDTIDRLLECWDRLLHAIVSNPDGRIDEYGLLSPEAVHEQTIAWNETAEDWPHPPCVHEAIAVAAARSPDAVAVTCEDEHLSYGALQAAAARLASRLRDAGVSVESSVGLLTDRSSDLVVGLAGTLAAGGVYVPLDPSAPAERMRFVLRDAGVVSVVVSEAMRARVPGAGLPVIAIDRTPPRETRESPVGAPAPRPAADNLCYVLYTSGTTGEPKGVAVTHAAVMNLLADFERACRVGPADAMLSIAPITFDIATLEVFLPLVSGARVVIAPGHTAADGADLRARLAGERISILQATPPTWRLLLDTGWRAGAGFRALTGAEPLPPALARRMLAAAAQVWNCYGPTETTIYSTFERLQSADEPITIGGPMANTSIYVLDRRLQPLPTGVTGEVYIGGVGLARGYLGRPDLTAASFRPDPFSPRPGSRVYASGDLGRYRPDGRIDCRGRRDLQVKLHGRRIELEAIAHVLDTHPRVTSSVVVVREDASRGPFLAAYVTTPQPDGISRADLREHVADRLPAYMVPSAIVVLDALPRTRRGKLDRNALPQPSEPDFRLAATMLAPRTVSEEAIARVWREVLGLAVVGAEDDFFALGGNSLQATRVLYLIRGALGVDLSITAFFESPTVAGLAGCADEILRGSGGSSEDAAVVRRGSTLTLAPQQENWWRNAFLTNNVHPNNIQLRVRLGGELDANALEQALARFQRRHEALRTGFVADEHGEGAPAITPPEKCDFRVATVDLSHLAADAQPAALRRVLQEDNDWPFDLTGPSLCRVTLVRLGAADQIVLFTTHHLVFDEWSMEILMKEVSELYASHLAGTPAGLPELAFQYADFAQWQRAWLDGPAAAAQRAYWCGQLAPPLPALRAASATDAMDGPYLSIRGRAPFALRPDAADAARRLAADEGCTLFSTVMAALKLVLYARTGQPDVRIGTLAANRGLAGAERAVGLFTNVVCLRTHVDRSPRFRDLVHDVHATIAGATTRQDYPFELVARALEEEHGTLRSSLFQVMVVWLALPSTPIAFRGIDTRPYRPEDDEGPSIVFVRNSLDLRFELAETPGAVNGSITYHMTRFDTAEVLGFAAAIERCITLADRDPSVTVSALCEMLQEQGARAVQRGDRLLA